MNTVAIPSGARGVDTNAIISAGAAAALFAYGYRFAVRYVPRIVAHANDLTAAELATLHAAGLALMPVQHVESEASWQPSGPKGTDYGIVAAASAAKAGVPRGTSLWCDLEGVWVGVPTQSIIDYCNAWHNAVEAAGYLPGLYVGWHAGLDAAHLYRSLKFSRYWAAYNLDADQCPAVRGVCMRQHVSTSADVTAGVPFSFQVDTIAPDAMGGVPVVCAPDSWADSCREVIV